jgi:DNA-binding transcriptional LysR family regulator
MRSPVRQLRSLNRLVYYAAVVETGSFTAAAKQLGVTKAVVSEHVARLESESSATLLVRTTRRVAPTDAGRAFYTRCTAILRDCEDAFEELEHTASTPKGHIRVTAPYDYGEAIVAPVAAAFTRHHPGCSVTLLVSDKILDLVSEQIDISVRVGWLDDSSLQARSLGSFRELLVCGSEFARTSRRFDDPAALEGLPWVVNATHNDPLQHRFRRERDGERREVRIRSAIMIDAAPAVLQAVVAGGGFAVLPDYLVVGHIAAGRLHHVLPEWALRTGGIHAVLPPARFRPAKVKAFIELLIQAERARARERGPLSRD